MIAALPAAIIFDMDGLLLDTERVGSETMIAAMAEMGFAMTEAQYHPLIGLPKDAERSAFTDQFGPGFRADQDYPAMRCIQTRIKAEHYGDKRPVKAGVAAVIAAAQALGLPCAVATSSERDTTLAHLGHMDLARHMTAIVTRDDVVRGKPFPDLYLAAAAALGLPPAACLALEDSYNGVRAAHAAGVPVIMVPDILPATDEMRALALAIADDLNVVAAWLMMTSHGPQTLSSRA